MTTPFQDRFNCSGGFYPNQSLINGVPDTLIDGKNMWVLGPDLLQSWGGTTSFATFGNRIMILLGDKIATLPSGSAAAFRSGATFFVGSSSGSIVVGTSDADKKNLGTVIPTLRFSVDGISPAVNVGLLTPIINPAQSPLSVSPTASVKKQQGSYSIKVTAVRISSGGESTGSAATNVVTLDGTKMLRLNIPAYMTGQDQLRVYGSERGKGSSGPWKFYKNYNVADLGGATFIDLEWFDGELGDGLPPLGEPNSNIPFSPASHVFILGNVVVLAGVLGGAGISPSMPGKGESFPPDTITFLNPAESILGIRGRPADGWQYVFCRNSLHAVILTGNELAPVIPRAIWSETGISGPSAATFVGGEFYGFSAKKGAVRTTAGNQSAEPDSSFALPVENYMETWDPNFVVVGWDQDHDCVYYFHNNIALAYMRKLGIWSLPFDLFDAGLTDFVSSCVTYKGKVIISAGANMYEMSGTQAIPFNVVYIHKDGGSPGFLKTIYRWRTACKVTAGASLKTDLLTNFDLATVRDSQTITGNGKDVYGSFKKSNTKNAVSYTFRHSGAGPNQFIYDLTCEGGATRMTI